MSHSQQKALLLASLLFAACGAIRTIEQQFVSADPSTPGSMGTKFLVGFMQNVLPRTVGNTVPHAYLLVTTNETGVVEFDVTTMFGGVQSSSTYTVDSTAPTRVNFPADDVYVTNIQDRDKAIWVQTSNNKKIAIKVVNDEFRSTDGFVALPCDGMTVPSHFRTYQYLILSTNQDSTGQSGSTARSSQFLVITCDDDTEVAVTPSTAISGSGVFQHTLFGPGTSQTSSNWRINNNNLIPAQQTLLISITNQDLTGTVVQGNKPLVVISGHQCGQVTERVTACDHMAAQIPPHTTWGYTFLLNPLSGRRSGDFYRFATLQDNTNVTITCVDAGSSTSTVEHTTTLNSAENPNWGQFQTHSEACADPYAPKYCCLESSNPVVLAQYSYGYKRDATCNGGEFGDPFMSVIPPMVQYLRLYHLLPVNISSGPIVNHFFSVSVPARYYQTDGIMLDNAPLELDATLWQAIYCSTGEVCGYGITKDFDNQYHSLFHSDANATIFVHTYGFSIQNSYAIAGGMELQPISGIIIRCTVPADCVVEGSSVTVTCTRSPDLTQRSRIQVNTEDGSATAPADYTTLNIPENRPSFFADNVLNYRGGTNQDSVRSFEIQTTADSDDTEPQETFFLNVSPVRTAIVLTPRVSITICGATQDIRCPDLADPANGVVVVAGTTPGDAATYTCNDGYKLDGASNTTCGPDGQWSSDPPVCLGETRRVKNIRILDDKYVESDEIFIAVFTFKHFQHSATVTILDLDGYCQNITDFKNGKVSLSGVLVGDTATFTCDDGYELVGDSVLYCLSGGTWDNSPPVCQGPTVEFEHSSYTVTEGFDEFVELIVKAENVKIFLALNVSFNQDSAEAGYDFDATPQVEALAPGQREERVRVLIIDDSTTEETEIFTAILSTGDMDTPAVATVTILDNDSDRADGNTGAIITATIAVVILLGAAIIVVAVLTLITYSRKKRRSKVEIPIQEPIYDDPDNPCYTKSFEYKVPSGAITSPNKTTAVPMPPMNENLAYGALQPTELQPTGAEDQC